MSSFNVAVVGVGAVGEAMIRTLKRRRFPLGELRVLARSARKIHVDGQEYPVSVTEPDAFNGVDIALFAGTEGEKGASAEFARAAACRGATVIDNSSYFRMDPQVPLVVPEVNPEALNDHDGLISNPNCSTIQMVVALKPLHDAARLTRVIVSTYQAVSGAGRSSVEALRRQTQEQAAGQTPTISKDQFVGNIMAFNLVPQIDAFSDLGYTNEEWKMVRETHKILGDSTIPITATCVRAPVYYGHSESIYIETSKKLSVEAARELFKNAPGVILKDDPASGDYATPLFSEGRDEVFVSRIREDPFLPNGMSLWVVADNVLKGAATNAVQIAEELVRRGRVRARA